METMRTKKVMETMIERRDSDDIMQKIDLNVLQKTYTACKSRSKHNKTNYPNMCFRTDNLSASSFSSCDIWS